MYVKRHYSFWMTVKWSKRPLIYGFLYAAAIVLIFEITFLEFTLPWEPISVIGIAVAFYLGFKNNSSYDRTWEARKIWGSIVNNSRTFTTAILSMLESKDAVTDKEIKKKIVYRHIAWVHALNYTLRKKRTWEHPEDPLKMVFTPTFRESYSKELSEILAPFISSTEWENVKSKNNIPSQILKTQSENLRQLKEDGLVSDYKHVWLHEIIGKLYDDQGMCERIKNFPLPRQYASVALWMNYVFCALIPFGMLNIFEGSRDLYIWLTIPFSGLIIWIFFLMDRIGDYSENPFEPAYNSLPISTLSRSIEIDLREMLDDDNLPDQYPVENGFSM